MSPRKIAFGILALLAGALAVTLASSGRAHANDPVKSAKLAASYRRLAPEATNEFPTWMVRVSVDRDNHTYKVDDTIKVTVVSEQAGYLYLFNIDGQGEVSCLFPNTFQSKNQIEAKVPVTVPDPKDTSWRITVKRPVGKELLKAIVTKKPLEAFGGVTLNNRGGATAISRGTFRKLVTEASVGRAAGDEAPMSPDDLRKPEEFKKYLDRSGEWAEHNIEVITSEDKAPAEKRVGLFVGISKYSDNGIRTLSGPHRDARRMAEAMKKSCGLSGEPRLLLNERATLTNVRDAFRELADTTRPGDVVFIYWAGHGGTAAAVGNGTGAYDAFLVPYDAKLGSDADLRRTTLSDRTFGRWMQELDGRRVVVILDTCHSGGQIEGQKAGTLAKADLDPMKRYLRGVSVPGSVKVQTPGREKPCFLSSQTVRARAIGQRQAAVLAASTFRQLAFERREDDHTGVLTYYILEALEKSSGPLTLRDIHQYARGRVKHYVETNFEGTTQDPVFADQEGSPVVLKK
jgi:hypothetical protein